MPFLFGMLPACHTSRLGCFYAWTSPLIQQRTGVGSSGGRRRENLFDRVPETTALSLLLLLTLILLRQDL